MGGRLADSEQFAFYLCSCWDMFVRCERGCDCFAVRLRVFMRVGSVVVGNCLRSRQSPRGLGMSFAAALNAQVVDSTYGVFRM
jgi:hypothetical protein